MQKMDQEERIYRVVLMGIENDTEKNRESFCDKISQNYSIPSPLFKKILDRCPTILKKNLSLNNAERLVKTLQTFGALVSVEEKKDSPPIFLEFQGIAPQMLALESSDLRRTQSGTWNVIGRAKNISGASLNDTWVLIQVFNDLEDLITFEEASVPINPIPPREAFPFKVVFESNPFIKKVSISFKNASGYPISAVDCRKSKEWVEVEIRDEDGEKPQWIDGNKSVEAVPVKERSDIQKADLADSEPESQPLFSEENKGIYIEADQQPSGDSPLSGCAKLPGDKESETAEEPRDLISGMISQNGNHTGEKLESLSEDLILQEAKPQSIMNQREEDISLGSEYALENRNDILQKAYLGAPLSDGTSKLLEDVSPEPVGKEEEKKEEEEGKKEEEGAKKELFSFPWIIEFRKSVETFYQEHRDIFSKWFETYQKDFGFTHSLHSLITILAHARFNQVHQSVKALENTKRIVGSVAQSTLRLGEIPRLEGTDFFSGEDWRDLFNKAFPKLQQVANDILKRESWSAIDLERLIRVIPHMSDKNSRNSVRWMHELMPGLVEIDFSDAQLNIEESLYRVASRLGVVDPHFDYYQGIGSMGEIKIQSFARKTFPQYPLIIEEPMTRVGKKEEEGGHCFPTQPRCEGCLFEHFCPRLYLSFNPSGKGMRGP